MKTNHPTFSKSFFLSLLSSCFSKTPWWLSYIQDQPSANTIKSSESTSPQSAMKSSQQVKLQGSKEKNFRRPTTYFLSIFFLSILSHFGHRPSPLCLWLSSLSANWRPLKNTKELKINWRPNLWRLGVALQLFKLLFYYVYLA